MRAFLEWHPCRLELGTTADSVGVVHDLSIRADEKVLIFMSGAEARICERSTDPIFSLPVATDDQPTPSGSDLAFSGGSQYFTLLRPSLSVPLRASTGFSAVFTFQVTSMPGGMDSNILILQGSDATVRVRVAASLRLEFEVEVVGQATYTVVSAGSSIATSTIHTGAVRYAKESSEMVVWLDGADVTQASVAVALRS